MSTPAPQTLDDLNNGLGQPHEMTHRQIEELRQYLLEDLFAFAWVIFSYTDLDPRLHGEIAKLIGLWGTDEQHRRIIIQIPRGHLKTSLCTIANSLWQVCRDPNHTVAIFNEKEDNSAKWIRAIRDIIQSSRIFQVLFRDLLPPSIAADDTRGMPKWWRWSDTELLLQRSVAGIPEASITGLGIGSASAGGHWNKLIKDDLISEDAAHQPSTMQRSKDWVDNAFYLEKPALGGQDLVACTPWGYDDVYAHLLREYNYTLYRRSALEDSEGEPDVTGDVIFPAKFTREGVLALRQGQSDYHWSAQIMCRPRPGKDLAFDPAWLRYGQVKGTPDEGVFEIDPDHFDPSINPAQVPEPPTRRIALAGMEKALILDPAPSEATEQRREPKARNAILLMGQDWWGRRYILDVWTARCDPIDVIEQMLYLCRLWSCNTVGIEEVNFSNIYRHWLLDRADRHGIYLIPRILKPGNRTKDYRIKNKISGQRSGVYYLNRPPSRPFVREYLEYPYSQTRDLLDAWAYDDEPGLLLRPSSPEERALRADSADNWQSRYHGINPVTGY